LNTESRRNGNDPMHAIERHRATSWTGTEDLRRAEPGVGLPPARPPVSVPRFLSRAGTPCEVTPVARIGWRRHTTTRDVGLERFERYDRNAQVYEFREQGWPLRVHRSQVRYREDCY
jgi:hypothetical protein